METIGACDSEDIININYNDEKTSNSTHRCAEKLAEGAIFSPACKKSFDAELTAVFELVKHIGHLTTRTTSSSRRNG